MSKRLPDWKTSVEAIRRVLMSEWNPIGCGVPDDEYDSYIPVIYRMIRERCDVAGLASHLEELETNAMGLSARPEVDRRVAKMLLELMD